MDGNIIRFGVEIFLAVLNASGFAFLAFSLSTLKSPAARRFLILPLIFFILFTLDVISRLVRGVNIVRLPLSWRVIIGWTILLSLGGTAWYLTLYYLGKLDGDSEEIKESDGT
jgi:hypothetical protein